MTHTTQHLSHTIAIVDAYSSGALYPAELKKRGYSCVHVQSSPFIDQSWLVSFHPKDFIENIIHHGDSDESIRRLAQFSPVAIIAGSECGVILADELSEKMGLKTNGTKLSETRRNKYLTHEVLRQNGLRCADQIKSSHVDDILEWATKRNIWPVVIKPQDSAGTEGVRFCSSVDEIRVAFSNLCGKKNQMGFVNTEVLAQELLKGVEYIVDTVSCHGHHYICNVFCLKKQYVEGHAVIYEDGWLLTSDEEIMQGLSSYVVEVLSALEIKYGPTHCEVMLTEKGPCLIELNARLHGGGVPAFMPQCLEHGQLELSVDSFLDPEVFLQRSRKPFVLKRHGRFLHFMSTQEGIIKDIRFLDKIRSLPSCYDIILNVSVGGQLKKTVDLDTDPGWAILVHHDPAIIQRDYDTIRAWEKEGIFIIA